MIDFLLYSKERPLIFTEPNFWVFLFLLMLGYSAVYQKVRLRNTLLLVASLYFYYLSSGWYFLLLVFSTLVDYFLANYIHKSEKISQKKLGVILSVVVNLSVLAYFKYAIFFAHTIGQVTGQDWDLPSIFLPVGISFFTFQTISYSIDVYRKRVAPVKNILDFGLYVSFFPQLVAGPIVRASSFVPQLLFPYQLSTTEFGKALWLIACGLIKKIVIADYLATNIVDRVFLEPTAYTGWENILAAYGYAFQIYGDFSGYTDIAIGVALLLGFRLPINFNSPYKADSVTDFWRRWHISLSSWLRDYLYIPLGGNRKGKKRTYINLFLTMLLGGLWHGAHFKFVVWGALHGMALGLEKAFKLPKKDKGFVVLKRIIVFHFIVFCWVFFRANSFETAFLALRQMTVLDFSILPAVLIGYQKIIWILAFALWIHYVPNNVKHHFEQWTGRLPWQAQSVCVLLLLMILYQFRVADLQPFIYFQF